MNTRDLLSGKVLALVFEKPSLGTRVSFQPWGRGCGWARG